MGPVEVLIGLPLSIKIGWAVWLAWAVAQAVWYRRAQVSEPAPPILLPAAPRRSSAHARPIATKPTSSSSGVRIAAPYGSPDFIAALDAEQQSPVAGPSQPAGV
jgi:hypothetical protein